MKRRPVIAAIGIASVGLLAWLMFALYETPEPEYNSKPLGYWLRGYDIYGTISARPNVAWQEADQAVQHLGTNAIPTLLRMLQARDSRLRLRFFQLAQRQSFVKVSFVPATNQNFEAALAFRRLGATASNAVPALINIYARNLSVSSRHNTLMVLDDLSPHAIPQLAPGLDHRKQEVRDMVVGVLDRTRTRRDLVVPLLVKALSDRSPVVRNSAAVALAHIGPDARPAAPALVNSLQDSDAQVRNAAGYALQRIEPDDTNHANKK